MDKSLNMTYSTSISNLCEVNSSFDSGLLRICYHGKNRNGSYISKESIERAIPTLYNCPIVCHYIREDDSLGGHDMEIVSDDKNDGLRLVNLTQPVGVIPESANVFFETIKDDNGDEKEYLCADALIWKRQEAYSKIKNDGVTSHSMEINVKAGEKEADGLYHINDFEFTAFALIGVEPCFEDSSITMFSVSDMKAKIEEMMNDLKDLKENAKANTENGNINNGVKPVETSDTTSTPSEEVDSVDNKTFEMKGGENILEKLHELLAKYNLTEDEIDFDFTDMNESELEEAIKLFVAKASEGSDDNNEGSVDVVNNDGKNEENPENVFELEGQFRNELIRVLEEEQLQYDGYSTNHYWFVDYDSEALEVYFVDTEDYLLYGASYEMSGDDIAIDYETKKRMKYAIVPHEEGDAQTSHLHDMFCSEFNKMKDNIFNLNNMLTAAKKDLEELESLKQFKASIMSDRKKVLIDSFNDLDGDEQFEKIKDSSDSLSIDEIEEKCFALRGRKLTANTKADKQSTPKLSIDRNTEEDYEPYHGAFKRFGFNN